LLAQDRQPRPPVNPLIPGTPPGVPGRGVDFKDLIPALLDALKDNDADVRQSAASALASIGRPAIDPLVDVLRDKDQNKELRANAAYVLGQMGPHGQEALPALTKALKDDDKDVRRRVAFAIQRIVKDVGASGGMMGSGMMPPGGFPGGGFPGAGGGPAGRGPTPPPDIKVADPGLLTPSSSRPTEKETE